MGEEFKILDQAEQNGESIKVIVSREINSVVEQLQQIKLPYNIIAWYGLNSRHYAVLQMLKPEHKKNRNKKNTIKK